MIVLGRWVDASQIMNNFENKWFHLEVAFYREYWCIIVLDKFGWLWGKKIINLGLNFCYRNWWPKACRPDLGTTCLHLLYLNTSIQLHIVMTAFTLQLQSWVFMTGTLYSTKMKIFTMCHFMAKVCVTYSRRLQEKI